MTYRSIASIALTGLLLGFKAIPLDAAILAVKYNGDVVTIDETTGDSALLGRSGYDHLNALTRDPSGRYFACTQEGTIVEIDPDTGAAAFVLSIPMPSPVHIVRSLAASSTGELYWASGSLYAGSAYTLQKYDPETGAVTDIGVMEEVSSGVAVSYLTALTFAPDGRLVGWDQQTFGLLEVDPATATVTDTGIHGFPGSVNMETLAYTPEGDLVGIGGYVFHGSDNYFEFDARGAPLSHVNVGALDIRGMEFLTETGEEEPPPEPPLVRLPERRPPMQPEPIYNLFLVDCGPCPACFERPCDPRANPEWGSFLIWDPLRDVVASFSRKVLGLDDKDGPITAAAPLQGWDNREVFVIALPYADRGAGQVGSVLFFDRSGKKVKRIDGQRAGERLGLMMDVWADEVVIASADRLVRLRRGAVVHDQAWAKDLRAQRGVRVAFTHDMDGDQRPEIMLGTPYAHEGKVQNAGRITVIGSQSGATLHTQRGRFAGQYLGLNLQPIAQNWPVLKGR